MLAQVERYLKQSVVAKEAYVSSAAIVAYGRLTFVFLFASFLA